MRYRVSNSQQTESTHTWLWSPLKDGVAPLAVIFFLRDSDRELIHAVSRQGVYQNSPLRAPLVLPACWLTLLPVPNCVWSELRIKRKWRKCLIPLRKIRLQFYFSLLVIIFLFFPLVNWHFNRAHLDAPGATFSISTAGSTHEMRTDLGDMTLTLMSWASCSGGARQHTKR